MVVGSTALLIVTVYLSTHRVKTLDPKWDKLKYFIRYASSPHQRRATSRLSDLAAIGIQSLDRTKHSIPLAYSDL